jgi:histidinol-phosphatase (PHP family)
MDASDACEAALKQGLGGIAFTDHLDIGYPDTDESFNINFEEYFSKISAIKAKYKGRLNVLRAVEVGVQPHVIDESLKIVESGSFDYVLVSVHVIDRIDPYTRVYYKVRSKLEAYERYLKEIYFMITHFETFDMVGHFEYIIRYAHYVDRSLRYVDHSDVFDSILKELIKQGRGFEVNTGTYRDPANPAEYDAAVLKRYRELGGELVCLGSDAHRIEHIGLRFDYFSQIIRNAGFKYTVHFENRKPVWDKL